MKRFILMLGILTFLTTATVKADDFKHPHDPCPPGKQTVEITKQVGGGIGPINGSHTTKTTVCRPNPALKTLSKPQRKVVNTAPKPQPKPVSRPLPKSQSSRRR